MTDPLQPALELLADSLVPCDKVSVGACSNMGSPRMGRVLVAGELLSADEARALAGKLYRAAAHVERMVGAP